MVVEVEKSALCDHCGESIHKVVPCITPEMEYWGKYYCPKCSGQGQAIFIVEPGTLIKVGKRRYIRIVNADEKQPA